MITGYRIIFVFLGILLWAFGAVNPAQAQDLAGRLAVSSAQPAFGDIVEVEVLVDLSSVSEKLGAYEASLRWDLQVLELVEVLDGETPSFASPLTRSGAGELVFSQFSVSGAGGNVSLLKLKFRAVGSPRQSTSLELSFDVLDAAGTFANLLPQFKVASAPVVEIVEEQKGANDGFSVSVEAGSATLTGIGQTVSVVISAGNTVQAKGTVITARYDPAVFSFKEFTPGDLIPGLLSLTGDPTIGADGLHTIQSGGTQLVGTPASGDGTLGTMSFEVTGEIPEEGVFISITAVQVTASAEDRSELIFAEGTFGVEFFPPSGIPGDFNADGSVDFDDFFLFADAFGGSDSAYDMDNSGGVDFDDFFLFAHNFGKKMP